MDFSVGTPGEEIGRAGSSIPQIPETSPASHTVRNPLSPKKPPASCQDRASGRAYE